MGTTERDERGPDETEPQRSDEATDAKEAEFVFNLFDSLARQDHDAYEQILSRNDKLRMKYGRLNKVFSDLREAFANDPGMVGEEPPAVTPIAGARSRGGALTEMALGLDADQLRKLYEVIAHSLVTKVLERFGEVSSAEARMKAAVHLCHMDVLDLFKTTAKQGGHVRDVLIDELAKVLAQPDLRVRVDRDDLQEILERDDVIDQFYGFEACVVRLARARPAI